METAPQGFEDYGKIMSNYDRKIDEDAEEYLKSNKACGGYTGWNFYGTVWFDEKFKCEVKQYMCHVATLYGDSLLEIMDKVSQQFGFD